ncbi:hypothetical protein EDD15DRAFT_2198775 [Pisolithus albus]|nr:hypothetical protein EDD15DRAFT_2201552 [Pisolithus albus]KAI5989151.1 hypothetical protein EDD15DRAFT_2198775 [Pisolithus albus]
MEELMTDIGSPAGVPWKRDNAASTQMRKLSMWWRVASSTIGVGFVSDPENIVLVPGLVLLVGLRKGKPQTARATGYYSESLSNAGRTTHIHCLSNFNMTRPVGVSEPNQVSRFPDDIEREIFFWAASNSGCNMYCYLLVAKRIHCWLEPILYRMVDVRHQRMAELLISSLRPRPAFAKRAVKVLRLRPAVLPEQGAYILELCRGLQELTLQTTANQPDDENPLRGPLCALRPTTLSMDLASAFYGPTVFLPDLPLLCRIERLHLTNSWVARRGLHIGLQELLLSEILRRFTRLQVVVLWRMEYQDCRETYTDLERHNFLDRRIVVFNTAHFAEHAGPRNSFWEVAEHVVQWREDNRVSRTSAWYGQGSCQSRVRAQRIFSEKLLTADVVFPTTSRFMLLNNCTRETCNAGRAAAFAVLTTTLVYGWKTKLASWPGAAPSHCVTNSKKLPFTTMPKVANPAPRLSVRRKISGRADTVVERMAKRNALYLQMFNQHADLVRGKDTEEVMNAYHRVMSRGIASDSSLITDGELDAMEQILCSPTATLDDHVFVGLTAHSLLLSQLETMKKLPYDVMVKVDALTIDLRSRERDRKPASPQDKYALITPPSPLPTLKRPVDARHIPLSDTTVHAMLASPSTLVGKRFIFREMDIYYCIASVTVSLKECTFSLQYEDVSFPSEDVTMREMEERLTNSYMV